MKKIPQFGILLVLIIFGTNGHSQSLKNWNSIQDSAYSIKYPIDWEINVTAGFGISFAILSPLESEDDNFRENVNLIIQDLSMYEMDLDSYVELSENQITTLATDGILVKSVRNTENNTNHHEVTYTATQGIYKLKFLQYYWVHNSKAFVVTLTCEESKFKKYLGIGEKILSSFTIVEN